MLDNLISLLKDSLQWVQFHYSYCFCLFGGLLANKKNYVMIKPTFSLVTPLFLLMRYFYH